MSSVQTVYKCRSRPLGPLGLFSATFEGKIDSETGQTSNPFASGKGFLRSLVRPAKDDDTPPAIRLGLHSNSPASAGHQRVMGHGAPTLH